MDAKPLLPLRPPGRSTRKASTYSAEIRRLQAAGYTLDAIREALAAAGVVVSKSTVHRETHRRQVERPTPPPIQQLRAASVPEGPPVAVGDVGTVGAAERIAAAPPSRGRDVAAAFVSSRIHNLLLRKEPR